MVNKKLAVGLTVGALAAAAVVAIVRYRQRQAPTAEEHDQLLVLESDLETALEGTDTPRARGWRLLAKKLEQVGGLRLERLLEAVRGLLTGELSDDQAVVAEDAFDDIETGADKQYARDPQIKKAEEEQQGS